MVLMKKEKIIFIASLFCLGFILFRWNYPDAFRDIVPALQYFLFYPISLFGFFFTILIIIKNIKRRVKDVKRYLLLFPMVVVGVFQIITIIIIIQISILR